MNRNSYKHFLLIVAFFVAHQGIKAQTVGMGGSQSVDLGSTVNYYVSLNNLLPEEYITDYQWMLLYPYPGGQVLSPASTSCQIQWTMKGTFWVEYEAFTNYDYYYGYMEVTVNSSAPGVPYGYFQSYPHGCGSTRVERYGDVTPPPDEDWYWQRSADGTTTDLGAGESVIVSSPGDLYLRSRLKNAPYTWGGSLYVENVSIQNERPSPPATAYDGHVVTNNSTASVQLGVSSVSGVQNYVWYTQPTGGTPVFSNTSVTYYTPVVSEWPKDYYVETYWYGCYSNSRTKVTAYKHPLPVITVSNNGDIPATLSVNNYTYQSYQWYKNGIYGDIPGATGSTYTATELGTYYVRGYIGSGSGMSLGVDTHCPQVAVTKSLSTNQSSNTVYSNDFGATTLEGQPGNVAEWQYSFSDTEGSYVPWGQAGETTTSNTCCIGLPGQTIWIRAAIQNTGCPLLYSSATSYYWQSTPPVVNAGTDREINDVAAPFILNGNASSGNGSVNTYLWSKISGPQAVLSNTSTSSLTVSDFTLGDYVFRLTATDAYGYQGSDDIAVTVIIPNNHNYIRETVVMSANKHTPQEVTSLTIEAGEKSETISYVDGLGRPMQTVIMKGSPGKKDIVQPVAYDAFGRTAVNYLPYTNGDNGYYKENALKDPNSSAVTELDKYRSGQHYAFYQQGGAVASDTYPYAETIFESSPLNRALKQGAPGADWQPATNHTIDRRYETNAASEVYLFHFDSSSGLLSLTTGENYYAPGSLFRNVTSDEKQNEAIEYTDKRGRTICKKVQYTTDQGVKRYASTYYVYNDMGKLVLVLPPEAIRNIEVEQVGSE